MAERKGLFTTIQLKLMVWFLAVSVIPVLIIAIVSYRTSSSALETDAYEKLGAVEEIKKNQIENYFAERKGNLQVLTATDDVKIAFDKFKAYHDTGGATPDSPLNIKTDEYRKIYNEVDPFFRKYLESYGYYDIFFICKSHGHVMYTVEKESDLGQNLATGQLRDSGLAKLWKAVLRDREITYVDYQHYAPSNEAAMFVGAPVFDKNGRMYAVIALQVSTKQISAIMNERAGLGETGETYLVGSDNLMRSESRFEKDSILKKKVDTAATREALAGRSGERIIKDYRGIPVLSAYSPLKIGNIHWAIISEIDMAEAFRPVTVLKVWIIALTLVVILIVVFVSLIVSRGIAMPIKEIASVSRSIAEGDLTGSITVKSNDEVGLLADSFRAMIVNLRNLLAKIQDAISEITSSGSEILSAAQQQAAGAREQSSAVAETTSSAKELSATSEQVGESIKRVSQAAAHALQGMTKIKDSIGKTGQLITSLGERSQKIGKITGLIDDVADQTNLLAVNASIEAARAGEQGKGFTVVADEIRKLSDSTAKSTKDITGLVELIQHEMSNSIMAMESSVKSVDEEAKLAQQTAERAKEIAMSANQQISGSKQIAEAMANVDDAMKQIASGAQQSQAAVKQLNKLGDELKDLAGKFKTT